MPKASFSLVSGDTRGTNDRRYSDCCVGEEKGDVPSKEAVVTAAIAASAAKSLIVVLQALQKSSASISTCSEEKPRIIGFPVYGAR